MNLLGKLLVVLTCVGALFKPQMSFAARDRGGNLVRYAAEQVLKKASRSLLIENDYVPCRQIGGGENCEQKIKHALLNLDLRPNETRKTASGDELQLDFDLTQGTIVVLQPFYEDFRVADDRDERTVAQVKRLLVKEASHLWGTNDESGQDFANAFEEFNEVTPIKVTKENACSVLNDIFISPFEDSRALSCIAAVQQKYCSSNQLLWTSELARVISKTLGDCRFQNFQRLQERSRLSVERVEWAFLNFASSLLGER